MGLAIRGLCPLLAVFDMPTSIHFYRDVLGFAEVAKAGSGDEVGWAWLSHGESCLMLNTAFDNGERPPAPDRTRELAHADTILYFGYDDLPGAYEYLVAHGVKVERPKVALYGMNQLYLRDPDGYGLCLQHRVAHEGNEG